jgi:DNA-binding transcriptional MerR regulator
MGDAVWTLDELADRVGSALATGYQGQSSGRVRDVPDRRAIRYYTTLGLVDRPVAMRGRTALYGPRHLLQLVAIKRLQADGLTLAQVQAELAGAGDTRLAGLARLPAGPGEPARDGGLTGGPALSAAARPPTPIPASPRAAGRPRFWRQAPAQVLAAAPAPMAAAAPAAAPTTLQGIRLVEGATLLVETAQPLGESELAAILAAAEPLVEALRARRLAGPDSEGSRR